MNSFYEFNMPRIIALAQSNVPVYEQLFEAIGIDEGMIMIMKKIDELLSRPDFVSARTCSKGCSFCCHDIIYCTPQEIDYIRNRLKASGIKGNRRLAKIQNRKPIDKLTWAEKRCAFLGANNECTIYEFRPMICRTHNSIDDPNNCDRSKEPKTHDQAYMIETEAVQMSLMIMAKTTELTPLHTIV